MSPAVRDRIASLIDQLFGVPGDALSDDASLADDLQLDSLSVVELQMVIEDEFGIRLDGEDGEDDEDDAGHGARIETFGQLVSTVERDVGRTTAAGGGRRVRGLGQPPASASDESEARSA